MKFNTKVLLILSAVICLSACVLGLKIKNKEDDFGDDFEAPKESPEVKINHREEETNAKTKANTTTPKNNENKQGKKKRLGKDKEDDDEDSKDSASKKTLTQKWKELFTTDRSTLVSCPDSGSVVLAQHKDNLANKKQEEKRGALIIAPHKAYNEWSPVEQGYGNSAYFFDYLDATLQAKISKAYQDSFQQAMATVPTDKKYEDPYALATMLLGKPRRMNEINAAENKELLAKLKIIAPKFDEAVWAASLDAFKVNKFISEYNWDLPSDGSKDQAKSLIDRFDLNGDGRLSNKEFILAAIVTNQKILGDDQCKNCFSEIIKSLIDPIFYYTDCNSDNGIGSEEIWKQLQNLIEKTDYSFYKCIINDKFYRTNAVNDFILKASRVKTKGQINIEQFREAILLGYWGRQVNEDATVAANELNGKENRWPQKKDINCENMKTNIEKEKVLEAEKAKEKCKSKKKL